MLFLDQTNLRLIGKEVNIMEIPKIPSISAIMQFVVLWIVVAFIVKLVVPAEWRMKLFGIA